ncbi:MAG: GGDEF domain-containing protein [Acidobacteriota bacterium]
MLNVLNRNGTLLLAIVVINLLLGALCLALARGQRHSPPLRLWGWGLIVYTVGLATVIAGFATPRHAASFVGNALIAWSPELFAGAVLAHTRFRLSRLWVRLAVALVVLFIVWNSFVAPIHPLTEIAGPTLIAIALFALAAVLLLRDLPEHARKAARLLAFSMLSAVGVWTLRLLFLAGLFGAPKADQVDFIQALFAIAQIAATVSGTFALCAIEVRNVQADLTLLALSDALTGLPNRRATEERFQQELARARRLGHGFALLIFDVDHFKRINDRHGHLAGDAVLRHLSATLRQEKRTEDVLGRLGGDEFAVLLVDPAAGEALQSVDRSRQRIADSMLAYENEELRVTVSGGLAVYPVDGQAWDELYEVADERLYVSKRCGRNRVTGSDAASALREDKVHP